MPFLLSLQTGFKRQLSQQVRKKRGQDRIKISAGFQFRKKPCGRFKQEIILIRCFDSLILPFDFPRPARILSE